MTEIKPTIKLLCTHLNLLLDTALKAEHFRLAKFNKTNDDVVGVFWDALEKLAVKSPNNVGKAPIKIYLTTLGYSNEKFLTLSEPGNNEESRELLIALCFIICKNLNELVINEVKQSPFHPDFNMFETNLEKSADSNSNYTPKDKNALRNYTDWIKGQIVLNEKLTRDYSEQNLKMLEKIGQKLDFEDLSVDEILALCNDDYGRVFVEKGERVLQVLENHANFTKKEAIFWKWMDTVILERKKDFKGEGEH